MLKVMGCAALCLLTVPGRVGAELVEPARVEAGPAISAAIYDEVPPRTWQRRDGQRPWPGQGYRNWQPRSPYAYTYPRYRTAPAWRNYGSYRRDVPYALTQPYRSYGYGYRDWRAERYGVRPWPQPPGAWSGTPRYRWAESERAWPRPNAAGSYGGYAQPWR